MLWLGIILIAIGLDRFTKFIVEKAIPYNTSIPVVNDFFYLTYYRNKGAAWGILQNGRYFFIALTSVILCVLFYVLFKSKNRVLKTSISMIIGGAVGNLIDRIAAGSVVDFFSFYIGRYHFPIFNVSDTFVVCGTILLAIYLIFMYEEKKCYRLN